MGQEVSRAASDRAVATGIAVLAALGVGTVMERHLPLAQDVLEAPYEHPARIGDEVALRNQVVTVDEIAAGAFVESWGTTTGTSAHFLMAVVRFEAVSEPVGLSPTLVAADGRHYDTRGAVSSACGVTQVGLPRTCRIFFEVPTDALPGATLRLAASEDDADDVAVVDLGVDEAGAARLAASTQTLSAEVG